MTITVPRRQRAFLRLLWQGGSGPSVTFQPCEAGRRAFSYDGVIGSWTAFSGGFLVRRPGCYPLELREVGAARPARRMLRFGSRGCS